MFNGIQICPKNEGESGALTRHSLPGQLNIKRDSNTKPPPFNSGNQGAADDEIVDGVPCGRIAPRPTLLISHGKPTERGDWPWHAAIYKSEKNDLIYICGGSIIRKRMILTAAHCVTEVVGRITKSVATDSLVVFLGKYYLKGWEEGIQTKEVEEIHVNSEYSATNYNADIAILVLSTPMDFTDYVRPVCLWNGNRPHLSEIEGLDGVVVGWGYDEASKTTERLMMANMPVVPTQECLWSNPEFFSRYASDRTFCAGYRNGTTACNGDSGGGMFFPKKEPGKGNKLVSPLTWTLRGIVSLSVSLDNRPICDPKYHVVFTDAAKFYHWIKQYH
ncbi:serine protease gd-like isoform X2 [Hetaerina americana]